MEIRYALAGDISGMGRVYVDTWKAAYQGMIPQEFLHGLTYESWEERYRGYWGQVPDYHAAVLTHEGKIIGVTSFTKTRDGDLPQSYGEIISIYVLPEYWSMGYGKHLLKWVLDELRKLSFSDCVLWTLEENKRAQRAYERFGFVRDGARKTGEFTSKQVWEVRYRMPLYDSARLKEETQC